MWFARVHVCVRTHLHPSVCVCVCVKGAGVRIYALHATANNGYLRGLQLWGGQKQGYKHDGCIHIIAQHSLRLCQKLKTYMLPPGGTGSI